MILIYPDCCPHQGVLRMVGVTFSASKGFAFHVSFSIAGCGDSSKLATFSFDSRKPKRARLPGACLKNWQPEAQIVLALFSYHL